MSEKGDTIISTKSTQDKIQVPLNVEEEVTTTAHYTEYIDSHTSKWDSIKKFPFACFCIGAMIFTLILTSFESQAGGIVISISMFRKHFGVIQPDGSYVLEAQWQSAISGVPLAAQIIGQWTGSWLADRFGKKWVIYISILVSTAFIGIEFAATTIQTFLAGKTMNGVCLGIIQSSIVSYVADITPFALRGVSTALCNVSFSIGPLVCFIINYSESDRLDAWAYRSIFAAQWGFSALSLIALLFVPDSPTYYILKGKTEKAENCYKKLLKDPLSIQQQMAVAMNTIKESQSAADNSTFLDCFKGNNLKRTMVASVPFIFCPFSGVYFTGNYTTYWFQLAGLSDSESFKYTIGAQLLSITGCIATLFVVDRFGRRTNILYGVLIIIVVDFIIGGTGLVKDNDQALQATIAFMMMYGFWYNFGLGSVCYPIASENPTSILRTKTIGLALSSTNIAGMVWSFVLPYIFNPDEGNLGASTMFIFAGFSLLFWVYFYFCVPETANRTLEEVDEMYFNKVPLRKFGNYETFSSRENKEAFEKVTANEKSNEVLHVEEI
ncbi:unnamed protein product [Debaryomyces fabryi]|nr:unnamed protein product [Debaryomyces fabryi]